MIKKIGPLPKLRTFKKKLRSVIVSQNHYLNQIFDVPSTPMDDMGPDTGWGSHSTDHQRRGCTFGEVGPNFKLHSKWSK